MPELWSKIVFSIFCGGLPLISARFLIKRRMGFFKITVCLIVFCDVSMALSLTEMQSHALVTARGTEETPRALKRLQDATDKAQATLDDLLAQQKTAQSKAFLAALDGQIGTATEALNSARKAEGEWRDPGAATMDKVNSHDVFMSIPTALFSLDLSRYMTLVFALLVAIVYQGTLIASVKATVKAAKREASDGKTRRRRRRRTVKAEPSPEPIPLAQQQELE